jgi:hypothetical protein
MLSRRVQCATVADRRALHGSEHWVEPSSTWAFVDQIVHLVEPRAVRVGAMLTKTPLRDASATPPLSGRLAPCCAVKMRTGLPASAKARLARGRSHRGSMLTVVSWSAGRPVDKSAGRALAVR